MSQAGLDGLIDQFHLTALIHGAMACEVEISKDLTDIEEVWPLLPSSIEWRREEIGGRSILIPYQVGVHPEIRLSDGNFFWVPVDPDVDDPRGNAPFSPTVHCADFQLQVLSDTQKVLHNQGYPRYDVSIALERVMAAAPAAIRADKDKFREYLKGRIQEVKEAFDNLRPDDTFIHFDDVVVENKEGALQRGMDVRAIMEMLDASMLGGTKNMAVFMNRNTGVTETWGTVQYRIFAQGLRSLQRGSKRMIENIAALALRVWGIQGVPRLVYTKIESESEQQQYDLKQKMAAFWKLCEDQGWASNDEAAEAVLGHRAAGEKKKEERGDNNDKDN